MISTALKEIDYWSYGYLKKFQRLHPLKQISPFIFKKRVELSSLEMLRFHWQNK